MLPPGGHAVIFPSDRARHVPESGNTSGKCGSLLSKYPDMRYVSPIHSLIETRQALTFARASRQSEIRCLKTVHCFQRQQAALNNASHRNDDKRFDYGIKALWSPVRARHPRYRTIDPESHQNTRARIQSITVGGIEMVLRLSLLSSSS